MVNLKPAVNFSLARKSHIGLSPMLYLKPPDSPIQSLCILIKIRLEFSIIYSKKQKNALFPVPQYIMSSPIAHSVPKPVSSQIPAPDSPGLSDVPLLDFDSSTVESPFSGTMEPEPHPSAQTALNPEAAWFGVQPDLIPSTESVCLASPPPPSQGFFNDFSVPASLFPLYPSPMPTYSPLPHGATTADDLKL